MGKKQTKLLFIFCCFFALIFSATTEDESIIIESNEQTVVGSGQKIYKFNFATLDMNYVHIKAESLSQSNPILIIADEAECKYRRAVSVQQNKPINLFLIKKELQRLFQNQYYNFFLCVQCQEGDRYCNYKITIKQEEYCELTLGEQTSFYVNIQKEKTSFKFKIPGSTKLENKENLRQLTSVQFANIWVKGQYIQQARLRNQNQREVPGKSFGFGSIFLPELTTNSDYFTLDVSSKEEDYVTIGSLFIKDDGDSNDELEINDLEIMGMLNEELNQVCIPLKSRTTSDSMIAQMNGRLYNKKGKLLTHYDNNIVEELDISDGLISQQIVINARNTNKFCITYTDSQPRDTNIIFSIQLTLNSLQNHNQFFYAPQLPGIIYSHFLFKGEIAVFRGMKPKNGAKEVKFNMKSIAGFPDMLFDTTDNFPYSSYDDEKLEKCENPHHANRMTVHTLYLNDDNRDYTPLSENQPLIIVKCTEGTSSGEVESSGYCKFETSIVTDLDRMDLVEDVSFSQYILEGKEDLYTINIENEVNVEKIYLDIMVLSGDVNFEVESRGVISNKYYLSNKLYSSIHIQYGINKVDFKVTALKNSFYLLMYHLTYPGDESKNLNSIDSGFNYIQSIYIGEEGDFMKYIQVENFKYDLFNPFLVNFYSQNCQFAVSKKKLDEFGEETDEDEYLPIFGSYGQVILTNENEEYIKKKYKYKIEIVADDESRYNKKLCMIYVSGLELSDTNRGSERTISVSEGVPQYYVFSPEYRHMKYTYFVTDLNKELIIKLNLVDKGTFKVLILYHYDVFKEAEIFRNEQIIVDTDKLKEVCPVNEVCPIDVFIESLSTDRYRQLETSIYQVDGAPVYLEKNLLKQDILLGKTKKHYYLDIGQNESGDIIIDYIRGSGYIYAKIVDKMNPKPEYNPDWRGMYDFPKNKDDSLYYDIFLKTIYISKNDTKDCSNGCYVLITVESSVQDEDESEDGEKKPKLIPYRITITPRIYPDGFEDRYQLTPKVRVPLNQYVLGDVYDTEHNITYYQVIIPYDSDSIIFDWQADKPSFFVDFEGSNPDNEHDFDFLSIGHDTVFSLDKQTILERIRKKGVYVEDTLQNLYLTLGIWTKEWDTLYTSLFAFKVFMPPKVQGNYDKSIVEILHIRTDQKVQCIPHLKDGIYSCVYAVIFDEGDVGKNIIIYPRSQKENVKVNFYGYVVDSEQIEKNNIDYIAEMFETNPIEDYSSEGNRRHIFYEGITREKSLLLKVTVDQSVVIEVMSTIYAHKEEQVLFPNPSTPQVFAIGDNKVLLNFETSRDLLINIVCVEGYGTFYWEEEGNGIEYYISGFEDRLTLASGTIDETKRLSKLVVSSDTTSIFSQDNAGLVFYLTYYPRNPFYNFDQVKIGRSIEFNYRNVKFPLNYIAQLNDDREISVSLTFTNYFMDNEFRLKYDKEMFSVWGKVITEEQAMNARLVEDYKPTKDGAIYGSFDGAFASLYLSKKDIDSFKIEEKDHPYLFFTIEPVNLDTSSFKGVSMEVCILNENDLSYFAPENVYVNGKLTNTEDINNPSFVYKLRAESTLPIMNIEFSANSDYVKWDVYKDAECKNKLDGIKVYSNGRFLMTLTVPGDLENNALYLRIYNDDRTKVNPKLCNYIFKYAAGLTNNVFFDLEEKNDILNYDITMKNGHRVFDISFYPIETYTMNYFIKAIYSESQISGEKENTIALSESEGYFLQIDAPETDKEGRAHLLMEIPNDKDISYIKILGKVNYYTSNEFLLYNPIHVNKDDALPNVDYEDLGATHEIVERKYDESLKQVRLSFEEAFNVQQYKIDFTNVKEMPNYIKVEVKSKDDQNNKYIYFSPIDPTGRQKRLQLAQSGTEKNAYMWIKREQFDKSFYATVECDIKEDEKCSYTIDFVGYKFVKMNTCIFNYNYYVSKDNQKMVFSINNDLGISDTSDQILTFYASGGKKIKIALNDCIGENCKPYEFAAGAAITTRIQKHNFFELTVEAEEGDFISVGGKVTKSDGTSYTNVLKANGPQFTGYLKRGLLEHECYSIDFISSLFKYSFVVGMFYDKMAVVTLKDATGTVVKTERITNGHFSYVYYGNLFEDQQVYFICIEFPEGNDNVNDIPYTLQLTQSNDEINFSSVFGPQLRGTIYQRVIEIGSVVFFNGANLKSDSDEMIYDMIATEGLAKMYMYKCTSFPLCKFKLPTGEEEEYESDPDLIKIKEVNRMSTFHNKELYNNNSPIDADQYIMVVKCEDFENSASNVCKFQTSIYGNKDDLYLVEGQTFTQYILKGQKTRFIIDLTSVYNVTNIHLDFYILNGDVNFDVSSSNLRNFNPRKFTLSNKIYYSIDLGRLTNRDNKPRIIIDTEAKVHSYYTVEYKNIRNRSQRLINEFYTGINTLIPLSPTKEMRKTININNMKLLSDDFYYVNFYSLNCKFKISKIIEGQEEDLTGFVNYAQDIIMSEEGEEEKKILDKNTYFVEAEEPTSSFRGHRCMVYISGLEITKEQNSIAQKGILMSDGIGVKTMFQYGLKKVKYIYPNPDKSKSVAIYFKVTNPAFYSYIATYNDKDLQNEKFSQSTIKYVDEIFMEDNCKDSELCNIEITLMVDGEIGEFIPTVEVIFKEINNMPYFIPQGLHKEDFLAASSTLFLYTTLSTNDEGFISLDFLRGSGAIYAKIVKIEDKDENPDWQQYRFPRTQKESLYYEFYNKKIVFSSQDTEKCQTGCYLLITIQSSVRGQMDEQYRYHQFSIFVSADKKDYINEKKSIVQIDPENYVVGSLSNKDKIEKKQMYEFYQLTIPYDAKKVIFDWQSDSAILLINVGDKRPLIDDYHFIYRCRADSAFELSNEEILKHLEAGNYITSAYLTIGVYTENYESQFGTAYSFRAHFVPNDLNIYEVYSDQKTVCQPEKGNNDEYECLFMIIFGNLDFINDLMIYAKSQNPAASTNMFGDFINETIYDSFNLEELEKAKPNEDSLYNTKSEKVDFIFLTISETNTHFYVKVVTDKPEPIEFITSFKTFDEEMSPNPSSIQLYSINNFQYMTLKFNTTKPLLINIYSLYGNFKVCLKENVTEYRLRGRDDILSLALPSNNDVTILKVMDLDYKEIKEEEMNDNGPVNEENEEEDENPDRQGKMIELPGVAFYIEYFLRSPELNFDEIYLGKTAEFAYTKSDLSLYYYSKLNKTDNEVNVYFMFHDLNFEIEGDGIQANNLILKGDIITQRKVYLIKSAKDLRPRNEELQVLGHYDPAIEVGSITFKTDSLKKIENNENDYPILYLALEKDLSKANYKLFNLSVEVTAIQDNSDVIITEKMYQYGKLSKENNKKSYKLKVNNSTGYMRVQFSRNSEYVQYAINEKKGETENSKFEEMETKEERGKIFITFKKPLKDFIYLNVFLKGDAPANDTRLNNYAFKYINAGEKKNFFEYKILHSDKVNKTIDRWKFKASFYRIETDRNVSVVYTLKLAKIWDLSKQEINRTIVLTETDSLIKKKRDATGDIITLEIDNFYTESFNAEVIAQIKDGPIIEYVAYEPVFSQGRDPSSVKPNEPEKTSEKSDSRGMLYAAIGIGCGIVVILIILIIVIFIYNSRNKELMEQVNKISFVQNDNKKANEENLLLDDDNELK